MHDLTSNKGL